jgi:hypothetical protein
MGDILKPKELPHKACQQPPAGAVAVEVVAVGLAVRPKLARLMVVVQLPVVELQTQLGYCSWHGRLLLHQGDPALSQLH